MSTAAVVLAAGAGTRFHGPSHKLLAPFRGRTVIETVLVQVLATDIDEVLVVTGSVDLGDAIPGSVRVVHNPRWADGQATSLGAAVDALESSAHDAMVVGLGDQPLVPTEAWQAVCDSSGLLAPATYDGLRRNPVRLAREIWPLLPRHGDEGARTLVRARPDLVVEVPCQGVPNDIDTEEDLRQWS